MSAPAPTPTECLERAEHSLEQDIQGWRTDELWGLVRGKRKNISPSEVPTTSRLAYDTLWRTLNPRDATALLRYLAEQVLATRQLQESVGPCPACGQEGELTVYDGGAYTRTLHSTAYREDVLGKAYASRRCYHGPRPLPLRYEAP